MAGEHVVATEGQSNTVGQDREVVARSSTTVEEKVSIPSHDAHVDPGRGSVAKSLEDHAMARRGLRGPAGPIVKEVSKDVERRRILATTQSRQVADDRLVSSSLLAAEMEIGNEDRLERAGAHGITGARPSSEDSGRPLRSLRRIPMTSSTRNPTEGCPIRRPPIQGRPTRRPPKQRPPKQRCPTRPQSRWRPHPLSGKRSLGGPARADQSRRATASPEICELSRRAPRVALRRRRVARRISAGLPD